METILLTSGYPPASIAEVRKHWHVIEIRSQREAWEYLRTSVELPAAITIGYAQSAPDSEMAAREMLGEVLKLDPNMPVIISTSSQATPLIVDLVKRGAFDYVIEPVDRDDPEAVAQYTQALVLSLTRAVRWRAVVRENQQLRQERIRRGLPEAIQVRSPQMLEVMAMVHKVAPTDATVLVRGESGTGKELIARAIHEQSPRRDGPFTAINCGALSETLLTSELFGHVKGAFTGAETDRPGLIREAGDGTLFLDEVGTVGPGFQVMLLRVLDQRRARPVGGGTEYPVRCRIIAAANRDLEQMVRRGEFREDFYYRLNLFHIHLPPLRERRDEIPVLAHHFLRLSAGQYGKRVTGIEPAAMSLLEAYHWPGNVRQLRNAIERAVILCDGERLSMADLDEQVRANMAAPTSALGDYQQAMRQFERGLLRAAIGHAGGNLSKAARSLHMKRTTLSYRIKQLQG